MKRINTYILSKIKNETNITEKLKISKPTKVNIKHTLFPSDKQELKNMILDEIAKNGKNCSLNHIDVSHITNMEYVFLNVDFDGDISHWDVSNVTNMARMFSSSKFEGDISLWDVSNVKTMGGMFTLTKFNRDIGDWDVRNVIFIDEMFRLSEFNQDISNWNLSSVKNYLDMFIGCKINEKYKPLINGKKI